MASSTSYFVVQPVISVSLSETCAPVHMYFGSTPLEQTAAFDPAVSGLKASFSRLHVLAFTTDV